LATAVHIAGALPHRPSQFNQALANRVGKALGANPASGRAEAVSLLATACEKQAALIESLGEPEELSVAYKESLQALCAQVAVSVQSAVHTSIAAIADLKARETTLQSKVTELSQKAMQSDFDALTGVLNRRGFMARAPRVLSMACEYQGWCGIGFIDMDNFKSLNDGLGHAAGDQALIAVATRLRDRLQGKGIIGRLGGDEFCFILLATRIDDVAAEAERVKAIFKDLRVEAGTQYRDLTVSVGLLSLGSPPKLQDLGVAMKRADELMYGAKTSGKNRCVVGSV
jgi:diguanylate cyclase (GGDEF)-like protein